MYYLKSRIDEYKALEIKEYYHIPNMIYKNRYQYFYYKGKNFEVNCYYSKNLYTITFSSNDKLLITEEGEKFQLEYSIINTDDINNNFVDTNSQIGSDEVGVGDFFGPLIVVSSYIENKDMNFIESLKIKDSKKMKDSYISEIGVKIVRRIKNFVVKVSAEKLSSLEEIGMNKNNILAKCHNLAHDGIINKYNLNENIMVYVDQFVPINSYKKYVGNGLIKNPLHFKTSGETFFPSVAISSVIARYYFLQEFDKISKLFDIEIPKGAGSDVDKVYLLLRKKYKEKDVDKYVKKYFSNYKRLNS